MRITFNPLFNFLLACESTFGFLQILVPVKLHHHHSSYATTGAPASRIRSYTACCWERPPRQQRQKFNYDNDDSYYYEDDYYYNQYSSDTSSDFSPPVTKSESRLDDTFDYQSTVEYGLDYRQTKNRNEFTNNNVPPRQTDDSIPVRQQQSTTRPPPVRRRTTRNDTYYDQYNDYEDGDYYLYEEDYDDDDDYDFASDTGGGNFWSNPTSGPDRTITRSRESDRRRPRRTSVQNNTPQPPAAAKDFYKRLFWYGFDVDDSDDRKDRTMFGGTKGKFNGLSYLDDVSDDDDDDDYDNVKKERRRRLPQERVTRVSDDTINNDYDYEDYYNDDNDNYINQRTDRIINPPRRKYKEPPPSDTPNFPPNTYDTRNNYNNGDYYDYDDDRYRKANRRQRRIGDRLNNERNGDWIRNQVSSWFVNVEDDYNNNQNQRRQQKRQQQDEQGQWVPFANAFDAFLGIDRNRLQQKADMYDRRMGLNNNNNIPNPDYGQQQRRRRSKDDYYYDSDNSSAYDRYDPYPDIYDDENDDNDELRRRQRRSPAQKSPFMNDSTSYIDDDVIIDAEPIRIEDDEPTNKSQKKEEIKDKNQSTMTWEERSLAMERVPPADVPAWGPTGDLGIDARTKAIMDALEDLQQAQSIVTQWEKDINQDKESIAILRVDAELERKRLMGKRRYIDDDHDVENLSIQERNAILRQLDRKVDEKARELRYKQIQYNRAVEELVEIETRHWALMKYYSPSKVKQGVAEALQELENTEPAVKRYSDKLNNNNNNNNNNSSGNDVA